METKQKIKKDEIDTFLFSFLSTKCELGKAIPSFLPN